MNVFIKGLSVLAAAFAFAIPAVASAHPQGGRGGGAAMHGGGRGWAAPRVEARGGGWGGEQRRWAAPRPYYGAQRPTYVAPYPYYAPQRPYYAPRAWGHREWVAPRGRVYMRR